MRFMITVEMGIRDQTTADGPHKCTKTLRQMCVYVCGKCVSESEHKTIGNSKIHTHTQTRQTEKKQCVCVCLMGVSSSQKHARGC